MLTGVKVCDAMTEKPITVLPDTSLVDCAKLMAKNKIGTMVVKENNELIGIVTEQDFVRRAAAKGLDPKKTKVRDIMSTEVITMPPEKDIFEVATMMRDYNIRHFPVVDDKRKLLGYITWKDILKIEPDLFEILVQKIELREEYRKPIFGFAKEREGLCESCGNFSEELRYYEGAQLCPVCRGE